MGYTEAGVILSHNADRHRKGEHMSTTEHGGPAFPVSAGGKGITIQDYFAAAALTGLIANAGPEATSENQRDL